MACLVVDIFDWESFSRSRKIPKTDACVIGLVTLVTVVTNLAIAVFAGVVLSALGFAWKSAKKVNVTRVVENYVAVRIESFDDALYGVQ
jgi:MFS superfamily sulfate permease-like transporter